MTEGGEYIKASYLCVCNHRHHLMEARAQNCKLIQVLHAPVKIKPRIRPDQTEVHAASRGRSTGLCGCPGAERVHFLHLDFDDLDQLHENIHIKLLLQRPDIRKRRKNEDDTVQCSDALRATEAYRSDKSIEHGGLPKRKHGVADDERGMVEQG